MSSIISQISHIQTKNIMHEIACYTNLQLGAHVEAASHTTATHFHKNADAITNSFLS